MKSRGIVYLISGNKHAVVLVASVASLRKHWDGDVAIVGTDEAGYTLAQQVASDERLRVRAIKMDHGNYRRNSGYLNKTRINSVVPFDSTVFLDADTIVRGDITEVFPRGDEMVLTSWGGWVTTGNMMSSRIRKWSKVEPERVERMTSISWPAINTGVFGFTKRTVIMDDWYDVTKQNVIFICDEIAAQIMYPDYPVRLLTDKYNCSPFVGQNKDDSVVWHFHGKKHCKPAAIDKWWPTYEECLSENYADINEWTPAGDKRLRRYLEVGV